MSFGWSKKPSHGYGSFEYPQYMFGLRIKKLYVMTAITMSRLYDKILGFLIKSSTAGILVLGKASCDILF